MRFAPGQRRLELAAGEFARFGEPFSRHFGAGGRWRAEVGREWHEALRGRLENAAPDGAGAWAFETPVRAVVVKDNWTFVVDGRADQTRLPPDGGAPVEVREIKTVSESLPRPAAYWRETRRAFFTQLALYRLGFSQVPENAGRVPRGMLVLVEPATGVVQEVPFDDAPPEWLEAEARLLARFAETRWTSRLRLEHLRLLSPFAGARPECDDAAARLAAEPAGAVLLEAPTGFGKTLTALSDALRRLRDGEVSRILYVTGKNSGRLQVLRELERLVEPGALRALTLHSREEHALPGPPPPPEVWRENWRRHGIDPDAIFTEGRATLADARELGARAGVPPWEITRALLPLAELVLCDYNYVFSPRQAGVLAGMAGWDAAATLLVVDEAHNLPDRAAAARSVEAADAEAWRALDALRDAGAPAAWRREWEAWADFLAALPQADEPPLETLYAARSLCEEITRLWAERPPFGLELERETLDALETPALMLAALDGVSGDGGEDGGGAAAESPDAENYLPWSPRAGCLRVECLDAREGVGKALRQFRRALLMSATLSPADAFEAACGLAPREAARVECAAPWRADAYDVIVDARVDTRLKTRERHLRTTAETVLALGATEPLAVFFPSYRYAEAVAVYIAALDGGFRAAVQPAGVTPEQNAAFIEEASLTARALFLVMGGGLAEGVDLLGGRISRAMVVSPGLPDVTPPRAARMELLRRRGSADSFREVYLIPALRKVNQALGRLVRAPGQRARVVLHCRRFAEPACAPLLSPEYRGGVVVRNEREWLAALRAWD
jgi:Rad3-related DNA helicase